MRLRIVWASCLCVLLALGAFAQDDPWDAATRNGEDARRAFLACWRFVHGWLQHADPVTGLIPRNLYRDPFWNAKDCAADNYPFMVLSTFYTDRAMYGGRMIDMLETEQRVSNRVDRLPDDFLFETQTFRSPNVDMAAIVFGASEYMKDGLLPVTELLGPTPWTARMVDMLDDLLKHASTETEVGVLPATDHEVCGELMQVLARMHWMTGRPEYMTAAFRIADYFFLHHPPSQSERLRLDDHGCEVIGGLSEVYYLAAKKANDKRAVWRAEMHKTLDRILEVGRDEHGLLHSTISPLQGTVLQDERTDNWGYNYNAFLVVADLDGEPRFHDAVRFVLSRLMENKDYPWEGDSSDGIADSLEGGINLMNRIPVPEAMEWADYMAGRLLAKQRDTGVIEGWHGDGNFARTALMYALWKTQGAYLEPWRADLRVGAARAADGSVHFVVTADWPWKGRLRFDVPRHAEWLNMPDDYPRLNQFPEWFTARADRVYESDSGPVEGARLREGIEVTVTPQEPLRLRLK